jgi:hypothetical protein
MRECLYGREMSYSAADTRWRMLQVIWVLDSGSLIWQVDPAYDKLSRTVVIVDIDQRVVCVLALAFALYSACLNTHGRQRFSPGRCATR